MKPDSMAFDRALPLRGDPARVLNLALPILAGSGFRLTRKSSEFLEFESDRVAGTHHALASVAGRLRIDASREQVRLRARLDGLRGLRNLLLFLPLGLGLFFVALFMLLFRQMGLQFVLFVALVPVLPWVVLTPVLMWWIRRRTERALDALLANLVQAASDEGVQGGQSH